MFLNCIGKLCKKDDKVRDHCDSKQLLSPSLSLSQSLSLSLSLSLVYVLCWEMRLGLTLGVRLGRTVGVYRTWGSVKSLENVPITTLTSFTTLANNTKTLAITTLLKKNYPTLVKLLESLWQP